MAFFDFNLRLGRPFCICIGKNFQDVFRRSSSQNYPTYVWGYVCVRVLIVFTKGKSQICLLKVTLEGTVVG